MKTVTSAALCLWVALSAATAPAARAGNTLFSLDFDTEIAFEQALEERENGDLQAAIDALQSILDTHPGFHRARLALAVAYYQGIQYARARQEAETVLEAPDADDDLKQQVRTFLDSVAEADTRHRLSPGLLVGLTIDSNVNVAPDDTRLTLPGGGSIVLPNDAAARDDYGLLFQASLRHRYLAPKTQRLGGRDAAFLWQSRADFFSTTYASESDQNLQLLKLETGPAHLFGRQMQTRLRGIVSQMWLDGEHYLSIYGLRPAVTYRSMRHALTTTINAEYQNRDYQLASDAVRDSDYVAASLKLAYELPRDDILVAASVQGFNEDAKAENYSRTGRSYTLGLNGGIDERTRLTAHAEWTWADYVGVEPYYGIARNDKTIRWSLGLEHRPATAMLKGWTVMVSLNHSRNITNIDIYRYRRNQALIAFRRSF